MDLTYSDEAILMSSHNSQISLSRISGMYCLTLMRHAGEEEEVVVKSSRMCLHGTMRSLMRMEDSGFI